MAKTRRTLAERIANKKQELEELEGKERLQEIEKAVEEGRISDENQPEFNLLKRELASIRKVIKAATRADDGALAEQLEAFRSETAERMAELVTSDD